MSLTLDVKKRVWESVFRAALGDIQQLPLLKKLEGLFITLEFLFCFYEIGFLLVGKWGWFTCRTFLKGKSAIWRTGKLVSGETVWRLVALFEFLLAIYYSMIGDFSIIFEYF